VSSPREERTLATPTKPTLEREGVRVSTLRAGQVVCCRASHRAAVRGIGFRRLTVYRGNHDCWRRPQPRMRPISAMG
jgi:hypothetical protein